MNGVTKTWDVEKYKLTKGEGVKGWAYYNLEREQLFCPLEWKVVSGVNTYIRLNIDPSDSMTYLNLTRYEPAFHDTTYTVYFRNIYNTMSTNVAEVCSDPALERDIYNDKVVYNLRFRSVLNHIRYFTFVYIFTRDGFTYECAMKIHEAKSEEYHKTLSSILYSFRVNDKLVFNMDKKLEQIQDMDISKI